MKQIGSRIEPPLSPTASGALLAQGARFSESIGHLSPSTFIPKGVYRFLTHDAANQHWEECLARGMAALAAKRA